MDKPTQSPSKIGRPKTYYLIYYFFLALNLFPLSEGSGVSYVQNADLPLIKLYSVSRHDESIVKVAILYTQVTSKFGVFSLPKTKF